MQELTRYLSNIMGSVLLGLPTEIKELIYFDALSHAATMVLVRLVLVRFFDDIADIDEQSLPLDPAVKRISPATVKNLSMDVNYLLEFVDSLNNPILKENLDELAQTVALMQSDNSDEFFDVSQRNKKYGRVDRENGVILIEKYVSLKSCSREY